MLAALAWSVSTSQLAARLPLVVTSPEMFREVLAETASLREPVWGVSILAMYAVVVPFLPALLWLASRSVGLAAGVSMALYLASQLVPGLNTGDRGFNPLAWQLLIMAGVLAGRRLVQGHVPKDVPKTWLAVAISVLLGGFLIVRGPALLPASHPFVEWIHFVAMPHPALSKTNLGLARVVHFAAVVVVVSRLLQDFPAALSGRWSRPLEWIGRRTLPLYCLIALLAYLSGLAAAFLPPSLWSLIFLALDSLTVLVLVAWLLDRRHAPATSG